MAATELSHYKEVTMTDEQIEKAAQDYAEPTRTYLLGEETMQIKEAFVAGAYHALQHKWVSVDERLPEDDVLVVVWTENSTILTDFCEKGKWHYYGVRYWLPIPPLNPEKK